MNTIEKLGKNIQKIIEQNRELAQKNEQLEDKVKRIEKDLKFLEGRNQEMPEVTLKNRKLLSEREKIAIKIDSILKRLEEVKV